MKVLITGASGFVGSFLLKQLIKEGKHKVAVILRDPLNAWRIQSCLKNVYLIKGSLDDPDSYRSQFSIFRPDVLIHLAWDGVGSKSRNAKGQWRNVSYMLELMEIAVAQDVGTFIGLGSQAEYGLVNASIDENEITKPTTLYGVSKLAACNIGQVMAASSNIRFSWLRLFSSYGPMDQPDWLIPYLINSLLRGESPNLTLAEQLWDFIHVSDVASAIKIMIDKPNANGIFNIGSGNALPLKSIIEKTRDLINPSLALNFGAIPYRLDQVMHLEANIDLLSNATGWKPIVGINEGLLETVNWWKSVK
jgi:UDP-glucose 4-epimerase